MFKILVVDDDKSASRLMQIILDEAGYQVTVAGNGAAALELLDNEYVDLIILDLNMPKMDGHEFMSTIRSNGINTPVIVVTSKLLADDKYQAFTDGADDFLTKPIDVQELIFRIKALLRRSHIVNEQKLTIGKVTLDYDALTVQREDEIQTLPKKEFYLLYKLLSYPDKIFTRLQLIDEIWGMNVNTVDTTVNVHINRLRNKFKNYPEFTIIAIKGLGYKAEINSEFKKSR